MWAGSASDFRMACSTAAASACTRASMPALGSTVGEITCQPSAFTRICHCPASAASASATAGCLAAAGCAAAAAQANRLIVPQASTDFPGQFFNVFGLLQSGHGKHEAVFFLQVLLQLLRQLGELRGVFEVLFMLHLENLVALQLAV